MGCWHETCGITQLPIRYHDPIVLFLITHRGEQASHAGDCYSNHMWTPRFLPIHGIYNDYGGITEIQLDWNTQYILSSMQEDIAEYRLRSHKSSEDREENNLDLQNLTIELIVDAIDSNSIWVPSNEPAPNPVGFMIVHAWVYDLLSQGYHTWDGETTRHSLQAYGEKFYSNVVAEKMADCEISGKDIIKRQLFYLKPQADHRNPFNCLTADGKLDGYNVGRGIRNYLDVIWELAGTNVSYQQPEIQQIFGDLGKFIIFNNNMAQLRKQWQPQAGKGSQYEGLDVHAQLIKASLRWIDGINAEYDEEWDDGDQQEESEA